MANFEFKPNGNQPDLENFKKPKNNDFIKCEEGPGVVAYLLTLGRLSNPTIPSIMLELSAGHYMAVCTSTYTKDKEPNEGEN